MSRSLARCYHLLCHWSCHALKAVPERSHSWNLRPYACVYIYIYMRLVMSRMAFYLFQNMSIIHHQNWKNARADQRLNKTKLQGPSLYTPKKDQVTSCSATNLICSIYVNFVSFPTREAASFPPSRGTSMTCSLTSKYRTNLTKTCRWLGKCCGIWCREPKEKSQGEKSGKELGSTYLLRLDFLSRHFWKRSKVLHEEIEVSEGGDAKLSLRFPRRSIQMMKESMSTRILTLKVTSDRCRKIQRPFIKSIFLQWW